MEVVTRSQDRSLPEWVVQLQRKGEKQKLQRATVSVPRCAALNAQVCQVVPTNCDMPNDELARTHSGNEARRVHVDQAQYLQNTPEFCDDGSLLRLVLHVFRYFSLSLSLRACIFVDLVSTAQAS